MIVEDLKTLPPPKLEEAAQYIHRLREINREERLKISRETFGAFGPEDGAAIEKAIFEDCEKIDASPILDLSAL
jgi:hypothetical protein